MVCKFVFFSSMIATTKQMGMTQVLCQGMNTVLDDNKKLLGWKTW